MIDFRKDALAPEAGSRAHYAVGVVASIGTLCTLLVVAWGLKSVFGIHLADQTFFAGAGPEEVYRSAVRWLWGTLGAGFLVYFLYEGMLEKAWPRPAGWGERQEQQRCGGLDPDLWLSLMEDGEKPLGMVLVDEPAWRRPSRLTALSIFFLILLGMTPVVAIASLFSAGTPMIQGYVALGWILFPLLGLLLPLLNLGDLMLAILGVGLGAVVPPILYVIAPQAMAELMKDPLYLGAVMGWVAGTGWVISQAAKRGTRFLLLTSQGLRLVEYGGRLRRGGTRAPESLQGPLVRRSLRLEPGLQGADWVLEGGGEAPLRVTPSCDDPEAFLEACNEAGFELEHQGRRGRAGIVDELRLAGPRLVIPLLLLVAFQQAFGPVLRLGLYLGLGTIVEIAPSMEDVEGAQRMIRASDATLAVFPDDLVSLAFKLMVQRDLDDREGAQATRKRVEEIRAGLRWPSLVAGESGKLLDQITEAMDKGCPPPLPEGPARGWEPEGEALAPFRRAIRGATEVEARLWGQNWGDWVDDVLEARRLAPAAPGPALLAVWMYYHASEGGLGSDKKARSRPRGVLRRPVPPWDEDLTLLVKRIEKERAAIREVARVADRDPTWRGTEALLERAVPYSLWKTIGRKLLDAHEKGPLPPDLLEVLPRLREARFLGPPRSFHYDPKKGCAEREGMSPMRRFLFEPPTRFQEFEAAWEPARGKEEASIEALRSLIDHLIRGDLTSERAQELRKAMRGYGS